jgi:hypothetical protein
MAGKPKHNYSIRQKPNNAWEILAVNQDGVEFWHGDFSLKQNAVRWGDSHKIEKRYPQVVQLPDDPFGIAQGTSAQSSSAPVDPVDRSLLTLYLSAGVNQSDRADVADFLGLPESFLQSVTDPSSGEIIWQPPR